MPLNFLDILVLLGALQGFIISWLLFIAKTNRQSNRLLAILIMVIAMACLNIYLVNQPWFQSNSILQFIHAIVPLVIVMPAGPLIFFYVRSYLDADFKMSRNQRIFFYPVLIDLVPQIMAIIYIVAVISGLLKPNPQPWGNFIDTYNTYADIPRWLSLSIYVILTLKYIRAQKSKQFSAGNETTSAFRWPQQFCVAFAIFQFIWLLHLIPYLIPKFSDRLLDLVNWYPVYIPLAILVYWLSVKGYYLQAIRTGFTDKKQSILAANMSAETISEAVFLLRKAMEKDRIYLDPSLNLNKLANETGLPAKIISTVLNQHLLKSFSEFVNEYRVREIQEKMMQPINNNLTISGIAYDCGFNSQPTFHRAFKSVTGITPKEFIQKNSQHQD
jgi:AraC-like DNA-binding protein